MSSFPWYDFSCGMGKPLPYGAISFIRCRGRGLPCPLISSTICGCAARYMSMCHGHSICVCGAATRYDINPSCSAEHIESKIYRAPKEHIENPNGFISRLVRSTSTGSWCDRSSCPGAPGGRRTPRCRSGPDRRGSSPDPGRS